MRKDAAELHAWAIGWRYIGHGELLGELLWWNDGTEGGRWKKMVGSVHDGEVSADEAPRQGQQLLRNATTSRCMSTHGDMARGQQ